VTSSPAQYLPDTESLPEWQPAGDVETFDTENLYDLVDGQAEAYFAYGFSDVAVQSYRHSDGAVLDAEIWQVGRPADAYGLFTANAAGTPVDIGNDGEMDAGRRIAFWQDRFFVQIRARQPVEDADLLAIAEAISQSLSPGSPEQRPALLGRLPTDGPVPGSTLFFHQEMSIQDRLWLGGENPLGLGPETNGVLAVYDLQSATAQLLLVQYPDSDRASVGLVALRAAQVDSLVSVKTHDALLAAVFGEISEAQADALSREALR
jgi:hypothetical protein